MNDLSKIRTSALSRRAMLRTVAFGAGGAAMLGASLTGYREAAAATKVAQKTVGYQPMPKGEQRCDNCSQFEAPASCKIVDGVIDPAGWCKVYAKKSA
jgi:hypothetical protein